MVEIKKNNDNSITFICDGDILPCTFTKVDRVTNYSNYYCLWINDNEFYLFNTKNKTYALKTNTYKGAKKFYKIEHYSKLTGTFVAYRSDKDYAHILFEYGDYEEYVFKYVGEEYNGIRPVKGCNNKWAYYNVVKRNFLYDINKGLQLSDEEVLAQFYNYDCYTIYKKDLYYRFIYFDRDKHKTYYSDNLEWYEETDGNKIIGKVFHKNIYTLLKRKNPTLPIGYYTSKPRYIAERNIFIARKIDSFVIINNNKEICNYQWSEDNFIFHQEYILNKVTGRSWKIYYLNDGKEICTNWSNIRYDAEKQCIIADTENGKNQIISQSDIEYFSKLLVEKSNSYFESATPEIAQQKSNEKHDDVANIIPRKEEKEVLLNVNQYNELPSSIDFIAFVEHIKISQDGYILSSRANKMLSANNHICWIIQDKNAIAISEFLNTKAYKIIYYKENIDSNIFNITVQTKSFISLNINVTGGEESLYAVLSKYEYNSHNDVKTEDIKERKHTTNYLPTAVDYCIFLNDLYYDSDGEFEFIHTQSNAEELQPKTFVCWNIKKEQCILISRYIGNNQHQIVYRKINNIGLLFPRRNCNQFIKTKIHITTKSALIRKVNNIARQGAICVDTVKNSQIEHLEEEQNLPNINYCLFVRDLQINSKGRFEYLLNEVVAKGSIFCWVIENKKKIVISKNCDYKNHEVLHIIKDNEELIYSKIRFNEVLHIKMNDVTRQNIISKINKIVGAIYKEYNRQMYKLKTEQKKQEEKRFEYIDCLKYIDRNRVTRFCFDDNVYEMKVNDIWKEVDVFIRRQFVQKKDLIAVLLDPTSKVFVENDTVFYEIIGEGKDYRFNQDFNPVNRAIRDNDKRILLFYKSENGEIRFLEEVMCVGYIFRTDETCEKNPERKIIVFKLRSSKESISSEENRTFQKDKMSSPTILKENNEVHKSVEQIVSERTKEITIDMINEENMKENDIDTVARLRKLYLTMSNLKELGLKINDDIVNEINRLEEKVVKEKLLPSITSKITDVLSPIEREITFVVNYTPKQPIKFGICRKQLTNTILFEAERKEDEKLKKDSVLHTKSARSNLRITLPNGRIIANSTAVESLIEFIQYVGVEKVEKVGLVRCKVPLISQNIDRKYSDRQKFIGNRRYLMTCTSTLAKKEDIEQIARYYNLNVKVEII